MDWFSIVTPIIGLLGVLAGAAITLRHQDKRDLRDAYADWLRTFWEEWQVIYDGPDGDPISGPDEHEMMDWVEQVSAKRFARKMSWYRVRFLESRGAFREHLVSIDAQLVRASDAIQPTSGYEESRRELDDARRTAESLFSLIERTGHLRMSPWMTAEHD